MTRVYVALGSNLGDRLGNLEKAIAMLAPAVSIVRQSPIYDTDPKYVTDQPRFLNMVLVAETDLEPQALLTFLKDIETGLGRIPGERFGPRPIDLDIVFFGDEIIDLFAGVSLPSDGYKGGIWLGKRPFTRLAGP